MLRALAHSDRRRFVRACLHEARTAGELAALSDLAPASVSEHLKVLRKSLLLELDVQGRFWLYRTNVAVLRDVLAALGALEQSAVERTR